MSLTVKSISPVPISDPNLPIALRPAVDFPPVRGSIFDDPGDEKSWHVSQRSESLSQFYEGREPSWYASAVAPLRGADRVLDLGCGPGLTLQALLEQGSSSVLGIDRWPAFTAKSTPAAPIVAHDLTLPMPFLESASFDGALSHYALDYVSPICTRQILREAHRVLVPGGRLLIYMAAMGLGGGDESRTMAYSPQVLRTLLGEAGFDEIDVEASSNGRNSVAKARRSAGRSDTAEASRIEAQASVGGDTQLSASFLGGGDTVECELTDRRHSAALRLDLASARSADESRVSVCARVLRSSWGGELQLWAWRGDAPVASESARFEFAAGAMRLSCPGGEVGHASAWSPGELSVEPLGNAYARFGDLHPGGGLSEAERGAEGRQIVVESPQGMGADAADYLGPGRNRFLLRRASLVDVSTIDREWLSGGAHGVMVTTQELDGEQMRELLLWAGWRQSLLYLGGPGWESILAVVSRRRAELQGPLVLVDPALDGAAPPQPLPAEIVAFAESSSSAFVLLGGDGRERSARADLERLERRLLHAGPAAGDRFGMADANETLRYLTERTLLMRLRQANGCSWGEVGRRPALS
jgi:SAM-dependent methyltransferase